MHLCLRALLVLGLATLLHAARRPNAVPVRLHRGHRPRSKAVRLLVDASVLPHIVGSSDPSVANVSLTPWTYRVSYDESRVPRKIMHAQCLTVGCLGLEGGGEVAALVAKPIHYQVLVLRRVQRNGRRKRGKTSSTLRLGTEMVSVGCTCVKPSVVYQL